MSIYLILMALTALLSYICTWGARLLAQRFALSAPVRDRDIHSGVIPRIGGLGIYCGFALILILASVTYFVDRIFADTFAPWGILVAGTIIVVIGLVDDIVGLSWVLKLGGQVLAASIVALWGVRMRVFPFPPEPIPIEQPWVQVVLTVFLIVLVMNAYNFIDGLDGLAAGVAAIGGFAFFLCSYWVNRSSTEADWSDLSTLLMALLVGGCVGFLVHNWHPARIFMGDAGAMFIGLVMASSGIAATGLRASNLYIRVGGIPTLVPLILPFAVLLVPILDLSLAVVRRTLRGKSPFAADRGHLHHRLLDVGFSHREAVLLMYLWTFVLAFGGAAFAALPWELVLPIDLSAIALLGIFTVWRTTIHAERTAGSQEGHRGG